MGLMKIYVLSILLLGTMCLQAYTQNAQLEYQAVRTVITPKIDGVLNDDAWKNVPGITTMTQRTPVEGIPSGQKQDMRVIYDDQALYVYAMFFDSHPDSIRHDLGSRDDQSIVADQFYIGFDTYNTYDAYVFGVNASGVQYDYRDSDQTYDAVWESAVKINESGWSIEMRIPYSAIRFPSKPEQSWGFQLIRTITRNQEYDQWALTPRTVANSRMLWGKLSGLRNIQAPLRLSMTPFLLANLENTPVYAADGRLKHQNNASYSAGADLKYGIDEKFTVDLTLLPDFSQVKSDNLIKSLSYQEVTYDENRSFFKEGTDLFNRNSMFYSRRIGKRPSGFFSVEDELAEGEVIKENPSRTRLLNAVKLSGRNNHGLGIGIFNAITDNMYAEVEDAAGNRRKILTEPLTNYNSVVFDQQLQNNSNIYFINTNVIRNHGWKDANVSALGFTLQNRKSSWASDGTLTISQRFTKHDSLENTYENQLGYKYFIGIRKISGNLQYGFSHTYIGKTFDSRDMGYLVFGNKQKERFYLDYNTFKPKKLFRESYSSLLLDYMTNPETGKLVYNQVSLSTYLVLNNYHSIGLGTFGTPLNSVNYDEPRVPGRFSESFKYYYFYADFNSDTRKALAFNLHLEFGDFLESFHGTGYGIIPDFRYRLNSRFQVRYTLNYNQDNYNIGFADLLENGDIIYGGRELTTWVNTLGMQYLFKNDMSLSLNTRHYWNVGQYKQYYLLLEDGNIDKISTYTGMNDFSYNTVYIDLLFSWQFAPGSNLSISYKNSIENEDQQIVRNFSRNFNNVLDFPQTNAVSVKLLYYLDYQYLLKRSKKA